MHLMLRNRYAKDIGGISMGQKIIHNKPQKGVVLTPSLGIGGLTGVGLIIDRSEFLLCYDRSLQVAEFLLGMFKKRQVVKRYWVITKSVPNPQQGLVFITAVNMFF